MTSATAPDRRRVAKLTGGTAAAVALVSSLIALVFSLWPWLKPDPRADVGASAAVVAVERNVTVENWQQRIASSPEDLARRTRKWQREAGTTEIPGELAYVRLSVRGFKSREVRLRWSIYSRQTQERYTATQEDVVADTTLDPEAPVDGLVVEQWMAPVPGPDLYFARFEIRTPDGRLLDVADSEPFRGL